MMRWLVLALLCGSSWLLAFCAPVAAQAGLTPPDETGAVTTVVPDNSTFPASARVVRLRCTAEEKVAEHCFHQPGAPQEAQDALVRAHLAIALLPQQMFPLPPAYVQGHRVIVAFPGKETAVVADSLPLAYAVGLYAALSGAPVLASTAVVGGLAEDGGLVKAGNFGLLAQAAASQKVATLVAPAANLEDWNALPEELRLGLRVVLVRNLAAALWHCLGPYGPYAQTYNLIAEAYRAAVNQALSGPYEEAQEGFAALAAQMPEDTSLLVWMQFLQGRQRLSEVESLLSAAREAMEAGELGKAREALDGALALDPNSQEAVSLRAQLLLCANDFTPPEVWVSVEDGQELRGLVPVTVKAKDDYRLVKLGLFVDGRVLAEWGTSPSQVTLDAAALGRGEHVLAVEGRDVAGNRARVEVVFRVVE